MNQYFDAMFARKEFLTRLLAHSFNSPRGWLELACAIVIMLGSYWLSKKIIVKYRLQERLVKFPFLRHILVRLVWPVLLLLSSIIAIFLWRVTMVLPI